MSSWMVVDGVYRGWALFFFFFAVNLYIAHTYVVFLVGCFGA